jgi:uncharacterized protein (TIGR02099 family)
MSSLPPSVAAATPHEASAGSGRSRLRWIARFGLGLVVAAWSLLLVAWLALHWFILPHIQQWRASIEARASEVLGVTVRIGTIDVRSSGWVPGLELHDVVLLDAGGRAALRLPRVVAALSPRSLPALDLRFEQLLIDGPELEIRRDPRGHIFIAGLDFGGTGAAEDSGAADWFFKQREFVIRGGALRWTDEQRGAAPLALTDVQLVVRNGLRSHSMRLDATPPADWGDRFTLQARFNQPLLARSGDWRRWTGTAYADLPRVDVRDLKQRVMLPFDLSEGNGALRAWVDVREGQAHAATVDLALREVVVRLEPQAEALAFEQVEGRLEGQRDENGATLTLRHFGFVTGEGIRWPQGDLALTLRQREGEAPSGGMFSAQRLDIGVMSQVATRVPIGSAVRRLLADVNPRGRVKDIVATWDGPLDAPTRYDVKGALEGLTLDPRAAAEPHDLGRPGLRDASLQLHATENGGEARIAIEAGAVEFPGVFDDPLVPFDELTTRLVWKIESQRGAAPSRLAVQLKETRFRNADANGELAATWTSGDPADLAHGGRLPGRLELEGKLASGVATRIARYLPLGIPEGTRRYVQGAIRGGTVRNVAFKMKGHVRDFPFHNARGGKDGEFRIAGQAEDATFAFVPDAPQWPALTRVAGELVIDRTTLEFRNARAQIGAVEWTKVQGGIPNLSERPQLNLDATARGPLAEMLKIVNTTPIDAWIGHALAGATASGAADLRLTLGIPLGAVAETTLKGSVGLTGNDVRIGADLPLLGAAKGRVDFTQKGFTVVGATARVLGGDAAFEGGSQADDSIRFNGQGVASAEGLRRAAELGPVARVASALTGQAAYRANLAFVKGRPQITVTSNLVGLAIDLPFPLAKVAAAPLDLRYQIAPVDEASTAAGGVRDSLRLDLGSLVQAQYVREHLASASRVVRGGIGVSAPAPQPASGVAANINLARINVDAWETTFDRLFGGAATPAVAAASAPPNVAAASADNAHPSEGYIPETVALRAQELQTGSRRITGVVIGASEDTGGLWRANVSADQLDGYVEYRPTRRRGSSGAVGAGAGRIYARLSRLSLPKSDAEQVETLLEEKTTSVPGLDIVVDDFELRGKRLGRVEVEASNRTLREPGREPLREWRLTKLNIAMPEARLSATGTWGIDPSAATPAARNRATMDFKLALEDSGALLERLGAGKAIRGGKGELAGRVSWSGSPLALDYPSLAGSINVAIDSGQFLKAGPGAARLLSVLSLQSLPRRLAFDFRDLFEEGFVFDNVTGDMTIGEGMARTNNLRMRGPAAVVLMEGSADIGREVEDLRVVVVPEINAGTASLAYAIINPAIGIGTFLAQYFLRKPLIEAGTREFHVTGSWDDPKVERVERKRGESVSAAEAPPVPASGPN